jgi:hypothetical protein
MNKQEMAAEPEMAAELEMAEEHEKEAEQEEEADEQPNEEALTLRAADVYALQDILEDMRFQITEIQREACQDRLETQDMLRAILDRLPPTSRASSTPSP